MVRDTVGEYGRTAAAAGPRRRPGTPYSSTRGSFRQIYILRVQTCAGAFRRNFC